MNMQNDISYRSGDSTEITYLRTFAYRAFAHCFIYPSKAWISELQGWLNTLRSILEDFGPSTEDMVKTIEEIQKEKYNLQTLQTLQIEYTRLFINATSSVLAPPYASAYSEERWFYGSPAIRALYTYQKAGFALSPKSREMPDYLLVELEFMTRLCKKEMEDSKSYGEASDICKKQHYFLTEQLMPWVSIWRKYVEASDRAGFYTKLAMLIEKWLKIDTAYLTNTGERSIA